MFLKVNEYGLIIIQISFEGGKQKTMFINVSSSLLYVYVYFAKLYWRSDHDHVLPKPLFSLGELKS